MAFAVPTAFGELIAAGSMSLVGRSSVTTYYRIENGLARSNPDAETAQAVGAALRLATADIMRAVERSRLIRRAD